MITRILDRMEREYFETHIVLGLPPHAPYRRHDPSLQNDFAAFQRMPLAEQRKRAGIKIEDVKK